MGSTRNWSNAPDMATQQVRIVTVDPATARVEGVIKDGAMIQIAIYDTPLTFRWPQEGETWNIYRQGIFWYLGSLAEDPNDTKPNTSLLPGEVKISAAKIYDRNGRAAVSINPALATEGTIPIRHGDHWETVPLPSGSGALPRQFVQSAAVNPWVINHGLGRYPVGMETFDNSGIKVEGDVTHTNLNTTTITFTGPMSGEATYL